MKIKTLDINALEWFDKINGNSYFAGTITINYGMKTEKTLKMPFQYGYGESYLQETESILASNGFIVYGDISPLWRYCKDNKIILRTNKKENCLQRQLKAI
jgi:hypothetical protein